MTITIENYEDAIAEFRAVLAGVTAGQLTDRTPCKSFDVAQLVDHTIGTQYMIIDALRGKPFDPNPPSVAADERAATFDRAAAEAVAELRRDGALEQSVTLPFGTFSGADLTGLGALDTFQHAWDLAKATGQDTDLAPALVEVLTPPARAHLEHVPRGDEPAPYAPEQPAPADAPAADRLAAFLGREL